MLRLSFILLLLLACFSVGAQDTLARRKDDKYIGLLMGVNFGRYTYAELGLAHIFTNWSAREPSSTAGAASCEVRIQNGQTIIGPKIAGWFAGASGIVAFGTNAIYYTDFNTGTLALRPEIGFGFGRMKLTYGYNWQIVNSEFGGINRHLLNATFCLKLIKLK